MAAAPPPLAAAPWWRRAARDPRLRGVPAVRHASCLARLRRRLRRGPTAPRSTTRAAGATRSSRPCTTRSSPWPRSSLFLGGHRRGQLGELALLPLPGRRRPGRAAPGRRCSASTGRCGSSGCRPSSCRGRCWPGCSGLARVVVQSAGGSDSTLTLSFLDLGRAEALREHLLDLAGRTDEAALRPSRPTSWVPWARHRRSPWPDAGSAPAAAGPPRRGPPRSRCSRCPTAGCSSRPSCTGRPSPSARWSRSGCSAPGSAASGRWRWPASPPCCPSRSASRSTGSRSCSPTATSTSPTPAPACACRRG